jgi:hypothetical protein
MLCKKIKSGNPASHLNFVHNEGSAFHVDRHIVRDLAKKDGPVVTVSKVLPFPELSLAVLKVILIGAEIQGARQTRLMSTSILLNSSKRHIASLFEQYRPQRTAR